MITVAAAALAVGLLVAFFLLAGSAREAALFRQGARDGFPLAGHYQAEPQLSPDNVVVSSGESAAFLEDEDAPGTGRWQLVKSYEDMRGGTYRATGDPNIYLLLDENGREIGRAHLAFALPDGSDGLIFLELGDETASLAKVNSVPAFQERSAG